MTLVVAQPSPAGAGPEAEAYPVWLTGGGWPLLCSVHEPVRPARGAVVLCSPLLGEQLPALPLYRAVGRALAERGFLALRFDYEGTGDSGGPSTGPGRLDAWLDGVDGALAAARELCSGPLALLGVRSGALVAAAAAERRADVDAIALWDPWRNGRSFLRREHALHALQFRTPPDAGDLEVAGLVLDDETSAALASLRLPPRVRARRGVLVVRPGTTPAAVALETKRGGSALRTTADVLEAAPGEQEALFEGDPLRRRVPAATLVEVVRWLDDAMTELGSSPQAAVVGSSPPVVRALPSPVRALPSPVPSLPSAWVSASGLVAVPPAAPGEHTVYERALRIGRHGLFGVESVPHPSVSPEAPVVLFFPSGLDSHIGPQRLWVALARKWASLGARCIRVDLSGLGESAPWPGRRELVVRAPEAFDDVAEVVRAVGDPRRVVLVGLCSSAYQALESAIELQPLGVLAVNPLLRFTPPELADGGALYGRRRLCEPRPGWAASARRALPEPVGQALADLRRLRGRWRRVLRRATTATARVDLSAVDVHVLCGEPEADDLAVFGLVDRPGEGMRVEVLPGLDHALAIASQREEVADRLTAVFSRMSGSRLHAARRTRPATWAPLVRQAQEEGA